MGQAVVHHSQKDTDRDATSESEKSATTSQLEPQTSSRRWIRRLIGFVLLISAFGLGWMAALAQVGKHTKEKIEPAVSPEGRDAAAVVVTTEPVSVRSVQRSVEAFGSLHGFEEVSISARVEGRVRKILHDVSDVVSPTEQLLEIDPTDYELSVQKADRTLQVELSKLGLQELPDSRLDLEKVPFVAKAKSQMDYTKLRNDRISRLAASKTVSAEESESAASDYRTAKAEYENQLLTAETDLATIQMQQVGLEVAREQLANTKVSAPVPSVSVPGIDQVKYVVSQRSVSEGTLVRPGTEIFRVVINQILKLRAPVPERFSSEIKLQQQVNVFAATSATPYVGTVTRIYPTVEPATRTFQVEIQVPNPNGELKPGSFAKAAILTRVDPEATTVPLSAVIQFAGITKIFLDENGRAKEVPVTLGTQTTDWVEITKPQLPRGAQVITSGQSVIADGTEVNVRELTPAP